MTILPGLSEGNFNFLAGTRHVPHQQITTGTETGH